MSMAIRRQRQYTAEEFERLPNTKGYELIDGQLVRKALSAKASWIQLGLATLLRAFVDAAKLGLVFESESPYACFPRKNKTRKPDVSFIRRGRLPGDEIPEGNIPIPPDLAVEVISPNDKAVRLHAKIRDYQSVNVPLIWVLYPNTRSVQILQAGLPGHWLNVGDTLTVEPVLPGFSVRVADLFPPPAES